MAFYYDRRMAVEEERNRPTYDACRGVIASGTLGGRGGASGVRTTGLIGIG